MTKFMYIALVALKTVAKIIIKFAASGHFDRGTTIKHFYNPSYKKATSYEFSIIFSDFYNCYSKQCIFDLTFTFGQNITERKQ